MFEMRLSKLRSGEGIAGGAAILLFIMTFLDWFEKEVVFRGAGPLVLVEPFGPTTMNAWQALDFVPLVLLFTSVTAVMAMAMRLGDVPPRVLFVTNGVVVCLGLLATGLVATQLVDPPVLEQFSWPETTIEGAALFPVYTALALSASVAFGGIVALREARHAPFTAGGSRERHSPQIP
ncbi:MAG TPA: hypothetical protein VFY48_11075 [Solirubrobacterales bacterium]|nr:hypothetical protein [Solirubrobacterales bacterium]